MPDLSTAGRYLQKSNSGVVLGFDFGLKRIGIAVGQTVTGTASPITEIPAKDGIPDWSQLQSLIEEWRPRRFVVGLPLNMDGSLSEMSVRAKKFANRLHGRFHKPIDLVDERLTSYAAKSAIKEKYGERDFGDFAVDSYAAVLILESWLAEFGRKESS